MAKEKKIIIEDETEKENGSGSGSEVKPESEEAAAEAPEEKAGNEEQEEAGEASDGQGSTDDDPAPGADDDPDGADETPSEVSSDKKKKKPDKKTDALQTRIEELEDRVKRQMAEFDNFRKRTEKEKNLMFETGAKSVIEKILPVVDNFERGLATVPEDETGSAFCEGMNMIYKQLIDELDKMDVKPIEAVGCEFDPELHNAVSQIESDEYDSGVIAQEFQKGYTYRGTVVRHSMVAVVP
ncbi:MAG: nucleotide exchange factor GrpE [Lachnospiraceae bacterium]|nr:nucleotide exchange factor GrpE [Lachnospiraceae bacterium]